MRWRCTDTITLALSVMLPTMGSAAETATAAPTPCPHHDALPAAAPVTQESIYQLDSRWTQADGSEIDLPALRGKVRVLALFFASCEYACPIIVSKMQRIQAAVPEARRDDVGFVLVTMDVERDTPEKLQAYATRMKLKGEWTLLHGTDDDVRALAAVLGLRYRKEPDGSFAHSNAIIVLDRNGEITHRSIGLDADPAATVTAITAHMQ